MQDQVKKQAFNQETQVGLKVGAVKPQNQQVVAKKKNHLQTFYSILARIAQYI